MRSQEIFDCILKHARQQGKKSLFPSEEVTQCAYLNKDGLKCFAGVLFEKEEYSKAMEGCSIRNILLGRVPEIDKKIVEQLQKRLWQHVDLIERLQIIHDDYHVEQWEEKFVQTARKFGLEYSLPPKKEELKMEEILQETKPENKSENKQE